MPLRLFRRHLFGLEFIEHGLPTAIVSRNRSDSRVRAQVQLAFLLFLSMASKTVGVEERMHGVSEAAFQIARIGVGRGRLGGDQSQEEDDARDCGAALHRRYFMRRGTTYNSSLRETVRQRPA